MDTFQNFLKKEELLNAIGALESGISTKKLALALFRMHKMYVVSKGWKFEVLSLNEN